jgi:hypothetical protein
LRDEQFGVEQVGVEQFGLSVHVCANAAERVHPRSIKLIGGKMRLASYARKRRADVDSFTASKRIKVSLSENLPNQVVGRDGWTAGHQKELRFQRDKRIVRFMETLGDNAAVSSERTDGANESLKLWTEYTTATDRAYVRRKAAETASLGPKKLDNSGKAVFLSPDVTVPNISHFQRLLRVRSLRRVFNRLDADIFVVNNVTDAGSRNEWSAILSGGLLCTLTYITSGGHSGTSLAFKAAVTSTRKIWCSDEFIRLHPEAHQILVTKSRMPGSKFSWIADKSTLLDLGTRRTNAGRGGEIVAFVSSAEQRSEETADESLSHPRRTPSFRLPFCQTSETPILPSKLWRCFPHQLRKPTTKPGRKKCESAVAERWKMCGGVARTLHFRRPRRSSGP